MIVVVAVVALVVLIVDVRLSAPRDGFAAPKPPPWWARIEARHPFLMTLPVLAVVTIPAVGGALRSGDWTAVAWLALVYVVVLLATYYGWREGGYKRNRFEHRYGPLRD